MRLEIPRFPPARRRSCARRFAGPSRSCISNVEGMAARHRWPGRWRRTGSLIASASPVFSYYPDSPMLSQGVLTALNSGGELNEIDRACRAAVVTNGVPDVSSWFDAWTGVASVLGDQANADEARGYSVSAAHKWRRAAVYYAIAERYIPHTDSRKAQCYGRVQEAFWSFVRLAGEPVTKVEIPFGESSLPALFIPSGLQEASPAVIFIDGFDLYKEFVYLRMNSDAARRRGMSLLIVDTPGVGEALRSRGLTTRHDTEVPVSSCVDYLESRDDVDSRHIGLIGLSLGGYYAPRAAAFEKRIRCCVAWGGQWDWGAQQRDHASRRSAASLSAPSSQL